MYNITTLEGGVDPSSKYMHRIGFNLDGTVKEVYMTWQYFRVPSVSKQAGIAMDKIMYPCWETQFETTPFCVEGGCGNGQVNATLDTVGEE